MCIIQCSMLTTIFFPMVFNGKRICLDVLKEFIRSICTSIINN